MDFIVVYDKVFDDQHQDDGDQVGNEVIQTQTTRIVVKEKQHHQGHQIHDNLHVGHTGLLWHGLLPCRHLSIKEYGNRC